MINNQLVYLHNLIFLKKNYQDALLYIKENLDTTDDCISELIGYCYLHLTKFDSAIDVFHKLHDKYKIGYCYLLQGDYKSAYEIWKSDIPSPAQNWGLFFCELFMDKQTVTPGFLQVRSFLERDLVIFLKLNLVEYVQKIIDCSQILFEINPETYKIISKAFINTNYFDYAFEFLQAALDYTDKDAEIYYLLGIYYINKKNFEYAKKCFQNAVELNDNYVPAKTLLLNLDNR